jgi:pimeloyl-ACP methyl ester carboxylesterase
MKKKKNIPLKIVKTIGMIIGVLIILCILATVVLRGLNYIHHNILYKNGVNETTYIDINGQEQYVMMMGQDETNPVIIYLHGGPAGPDTFMTYAFSDYLTDEYTFIGWDQRGCGRTYYKNIKEDSNNETVSFDQALDDLDKLVTYACERFGQDKVIIMGHSYGTALGSAYVKEHPEKVQAYIGIGQLVSLEDADIYSYHDAVAKAELKGDDTTDMDNAFKDFCEKPGIPTLITLRGYTSKYHPVEKESGQVGLAWFSPYTNMADLKWFSKQLGDVDSFVKLNKPLYDTLMTFNVYDDSLDYKVPVCFVSGVDDWVCPTDKTTEYYEAITAPQKQMYVIDKCGHDVHFANPKEFGADVKEFLDSIEE